MVLGRSRFDIICGPFDVKCCPWTLNMILGRNVVPWTLNVVPWLNPFYARPSVLSITTHPSTCMCSTRERPSETTIT
jgi:hypothetical protein